MKNISAIIYILLITLNANARKTYGVVEFSANYMREQPSYTAELGNQSLMGTVVEILDEKGYWLKIKSPEPYTAWVNEKGVVKMSEEEINNYIKEPKYICVSPYSKIYSSPSLKAEIISDLVMGNILRQWRSSFGLEGSNFFVPIKKRGFVGVVTPSGKKGYVIAKDVQTLRMWADKSHSSPENLIETAKLFIGVPYMWGGASIKGVDCSGLTRMVWFMNGVLIPRDAGPQSCCGDEVRIFKADGSLDLQALRPGDLVFFGEKAEGGQAERVSHVGIYINDGIFIHSSQVVRINSLRQSDKNYYAKTPIKARRYIGAESRDGLIKMAESPLYFPQN